MKAKASVAKPWFKYYSEEALNAKLPEETLYSMCLKTMIHIVRISPSTTLETR